MCTPIKSFSFAGTATANGKVSTYSGQTIPIPASFKYCYNLQGNKLTFTMDTPYGQSVNVLNDVNGRVTGTMKFLKAQVEVDGVFQFN